MTRRNDPSPLDRAALRAQSDPCEFDALLGLMAPAVNLWAGRYPASVCPEDARQEVRIAVFRALKAWDPARANFFAYCQRAVANRVADAWRDVARRPDHLAIGDREEETLAAVPPCRASEAVETVVSLVAAWCESDGQVPDSVNAALGLWGNDPTNVAEVLAAVRAYLLDEGKASPEVKLLTADAVVCVFGVV